MKTYSTRTNAIRAARKELSGDAIAGLDFTVIEQPAGRWGCEPRNAAAGATPALQSAAPTNGDATEGAHEAPAGEPASQDAPASKSAPTERPKRTRRNPAAAKADKPPRENKGEAMLAMLWRPEGATVAEIAEAFAGCRTPRAPRSPRRCARPACPSPPRRSRRAAWVYRVA